MTWIALGPAYGPGSGLAACAASFRELHVGSPRDFEAWREAPAPRTRRLCPGAPALALDSLRVSGQPPRFDIRAFPSRKPHAEYEVAALDRPPGPRGCDDRRGRQRATAARLRWWRQPIA